MNEPPQDGPARGYAAALGSAVLLSTTAVFIRYLTETTAIPPLLLAFWRALFVVLTLLPALRLGRPALLRVPGAQWRFLAGYGVVLAGFNALWTLSVALNGAAVATVLAYASAAFTALLGWWLLGERLDWAIGTAVLLCLAGCVLVADALDPAAWRANPGGIAAGLLTGLAYAVYSLLGRSAAQRGLNPWTSLLAAFGVATLVLLAANALPGTAVPGTAATAAELGWLGRNWTAWGVLLLLAAGPTVGGFGLYNVSLSLLPSSVANLVLTLEPAFTAVLAYALLGERLTGVQLAGSGLIVGGVGFLRWWRGRAALRLASVG